MSRVPSSVVGIGLSMALHLAALAMFASAAPAPGSAAQPTTEGAPPLLVAIVRDPSAALPPPLVTPTPLPMAVVAGRRPRLASRLPGRPAAVTLTSLAPDPLPPDPRSHPTARPNPPVGPTNSRLPVNIPLPLPPATRRITADQARPLRYHDEFPSLPALDRRAGTELQVVVDVCVSRTGAVDRVSFASGSSDVLSRLMRPAIHQWRYHPLRVDGTPTAFCHFIHLEYRIP